MNHHNRPYIKSVGISICVYQCLTDVSQYIVEANGQKTKFSATELKDFLRELKDNTDSMEEEQAKKRRMFRNLLLEASEDIAKKYNKQVFTLSIGDVE